MRSKNTINITGSAGTIAKFQFQNSINTISRRWPCFIAATATFLNLVFDVHNIQKLIVN